MSGGRDRHEAVARWANAERRRWNRPGIVWLLTVGSERGTSGGAAWLLGPLRGEAGERVLTPDLAVRVERISEAVDSALDISLAGGARPLAILGGPFPVDGVCPLEASVVHELGGGSLDLAIALSIASQRLFVPLSTDLFATARICSTGAHVESRGTPGALGTVCGLTEKARAAVRWSGSPYSTRILVASGQSASEEGVGTAVASLPVVPKLVECPDLRSAFRTAFGWEDCVGPGDQLERIRPHVVHVSLSPAHYEAEWCRRLLDVFFRRIVTCAADERVSVRSWVPVSAAANAALDRAVGATSIPSEERSRAGFAAAVIARHAGSARAIAMPKSDDLAELAEDEKNAWLAHCVQHVTDAGGDDVEEMIRLAAGRTRQSPLAAVELKLLGALARLAEAKREFDSSWSDAQRAVQGWLDRGAFSEIARPLSVQYRLVATRPEREDELARLDGRVETLRYELSPDNLAYISLARLQCLWRMNRTSAELRDAAKSVLGGPDPGGHVRASARRVLAAAELRTVGAGESGDLDASPGGRDKAEAAARDSGAVTMWGALTDLDAAVARRDEVAAENALARVAAFHPGVVSHLLHDVSAGTPTLERAELVSRWFPY